MALTLKQGLVIFTSIKPLKVHILVKQKFGLLVEDEVKWKAGLWSRIFTTSHA